MHNIHPGTISVSTNTKSRIGGSKIKIVGALTVALASGSVEAKAMFIRGSNKYANALMLSNRYLEDSGEDGDETSVSNIQTNFMDSMSTKETRVFIAVMSIFGLSIVAGLSLIAYLLAKKKSKQRALRKEKELLPAAKRRSSVVALVRSSTNTIRESVSAALNGQDDTTIKSDDISDTNYQALEIKESGEKVSSELKSTEHEASGENSTHTRGSRFISKMDNHLKKKFSEKR